MSKFEKRFLTVLKEQSDLEKAAMADSLDDETNPEDFDTQVEPPDPNSLAQQAGQLKARQSVEMKEKLEEWVEALDTFKNFLNGTEAGSVQYTLSQAEADTIFDKVKTSEARKIARVATDLASLSEALKGYIAQSSDSQFKYV